VSQEEEGRRKRDGKETDDGETISSLFLVLLCRPIGGEKLEGGAGVGEGLAPAGKKLGGGGHGGRGRGETDGFGEEELSGAWVRVHFRRRGAHGRFA
jgi:hypothetical protein